MSLSVIDCGMTGLLVFLSVLVKPDFSLGKHKIGTYWAFSVLGALILLIFGNIPMSYLISKLTSDSSVNPLKILVLFFSMTSMSVFLDEIGFFRYLASLALRKTGSSQKKLFIILYAVVSVLTVFTSNDIVVLTFTPFICFFAKNSKIDPMPFLFAEFVASNTWSMLLIIGNPTNIYLASSAGIDFMQYVATMALPSLLAGSVSLGILLLMFRRQLGKPLSADAPDEKIDDRPALVTGVCALAMCTVLLAVSSYISFEMYAVAAVFALLLFAAETVLAKVRHKPLTSLRATVRRLPYELIPFVLSMFVLVLSLDYNGAARIIGEVLTAKNPIFTVGISSFLTSNIINNIPMSVLFSSILNSCAGAESFVESVYAAVIGSNIGAFFTPVGALAGIMWISILKRNGIDFSFRSFVTRGAGLAIPTLLAGLIGLEIIF